MLKFIRLKHAFQSTDWLPKNGGIHEFTKIMAKANIGRKAGKD